MTVIIDYDAGNLRSVARACAEVGLAARISNDPAVVARANRIIFPGVGAAGSAMRSLRATGIDRALIDAFAAGVPLFGICLGLQISLDYSEENDTPTLGLLPGRVVRFELDDPRLKIPHMGWNEVRQSRPHALWRGIANGTRYYFVHSYFPAPRDASLTAATCVYGVPFTCAVARDNIFAVQFHPEKSQAAGLQLLSNFVQWRP